MYKQKNYSQLLSEIESNSKIKSLIIKTEVSANDLSLHVDNENIYDSINRCDIAVAASGTITLQIALCEKPLCVVYKLSWLSYLFAKFLVRLKNISLVNIICNKSIVKEFIQHEVTSANIAKEITRIAKDDQYRSIICKDLKKVKEILKKDNGENIVDIIFHTCFNCFDHVSVF